jgi:formamidopyrimidine-DNA glycosylase
MEGPHPRALADHLNDLITGKPVEQILVPENRWQANVLLLNCVGQVIQRVRSHGKWLFFDFSHGITWLCQLITRAKWTLLSPDQAERLATGGQGARARRREPLITLHLGQRSGDNLVAVLTGHPIFYILPTERVRAHPEIRVLGPDPLSTTTFYDDFPYRLRQFPTRTVAAALLDQETLAGLGNTLKCEILYAMRFSPGLRVATLLASQIDHLAGSIVGIAATATNYATKAEPFPYRVYDRAGLPCVACGTEITVDRSGQDGHLTWYCPACQLMADPPASGVLPQPSLFPR